MDRRTFLLTAAAAGIALPGFVNAESFYDAGNGVAVSGYDAVAYFTTGKPTEGSAAFASVHGGATYHFASAENKAMFDGDPAAYAPQYGGFCAFAVSRGSTAPGSPTAWTIHDGKLYLNINKAVRTLWNSNRTGNIDAADANWPGLSG